jgi:hypothetical protein
MDGCLASHIFGDDDDAVVCPGSTIAKHHRHDAIVGGRESTELVLEEEILRSGGLRIISDSEL